MAVDQVGNPLNATILGTVITESGVSRLKEGQAEQRVGNQCTELEYIQSMYSHKTALLKWNSMHAEGPWHVSIWAFQTTFYCFFSLVHMPYWTPANSVLDRVQV